MHLIMKDNPISETPIYFERGGGWIGDGITIWQATWPFSTISIYTDRVVLKVTFKSVELKMSEITDIKRVGFIPIFADGVQFVHENNSIPQKVVFWSIGHGKKIQEIIQSKLPGR